MASIVPGAKWPVAADIRSASRREGVMRPVTSPVAATPTSKREIRRRVRREVMLRRLRRELANGGEISAVLRRPSSTKTAG
jgi:hypothetical protein